VGTYLAVINTALGPEPIAVSLDPDALGGKRLRNLVSGTAIELPAGLTLPPVSLTAWRLE
jgi:hypothetical protein